MIQMDDEEGGRFVPGNNTQTERRDETNTTTTIKPRKDRDEMAQEDTPTAPITQPSPIRNRQSQKQQQQQQQYQHRHTQSLSSSVRSNVTYGGPYETAAPSEAMQFLSKFSVFSPDPVVIDNLDATNKNSHHLIRPSFIRQGDQINGYLVGPVIGKGGGYCECRMARPIGREDFPVVFKIFQRRGSATPLEEQRDFEHELDVWAGLSHPHILPLLETIQTGTAIIAVMPLVKGGSLLDRLILEGPMKDREARQVFRQLALAVAYLHEERGIVHRDIKLDNILIASSPQGGGRLDLSDDQAKASITIYLSDFGLSDCVGRECQFECQKVSCQQRGYSAMQDDNIRASYTKGSIHYIPPESLGHGSSHSERRRSPRRISLAELASLEIEGGGSTTTTASTEHSNRAECDNSRTLISNNRSSASSLLMKADIWAMGVVLYAMVKGALPFCDDFLPRLQLSILKGDYQKLSPDMGLSPGLCDLVAGLLDPDVHDRLSIGQVLEHPWVAAFDYLSDDGCL